MMSKSFTRSAQFPGQNGLARVALSIALVEERGPFLAYVSFKSSNSATEEESPNGDASSKSHCVVRAQIVWEEAG